MRKLAVLKSRTQPLRKHTMTLRKVEEFPLMSWKITLPHSERLFFPTFAQQAWQTVFVESSQSLYLSDCKEGENHCHMTLPFFTFSSLDKSLHFYLT
jgi:hypothetical protein